MSSTKEETRSEKAGRKAGFQPIVAIIVVLAAALGWILFHNRCVSNIDLSLPEGKVTIEFCTKEEKQVLQTLQEANAGYKERRSSAEDKAGYDAEYQDRMHAALRYVSGETRPMGPLEDAVGNVLAPYLQ